MSVSCRLLPAGLLIMAPMIFAASTTTEPSEVSAPAKNVTTAQVSSESDSDKSTESESGAESIQFLHALTDKPLDMNFRPDQTLTPAVLEFHATGINAYSDDAERIAAGEKVYKKQCQACHLKDGKGRIGPNLTDDIWTRKRTDTQIGRFEVVYGGGAGAMQAFGQRIDQDAILEVMAFIDTLKE